MLVSTKTIKSLAKLTTTCGRQLSTSSQVCNHDLLMLTSRFLCLASTLPSQGEGPRLPKEERKGIESPGLQPRITPVGLIQGSYSQLHYPMKVVSVDLAPAGVSVSSGSTSGEIKVSLGTVLPLFAPGAPSIPYG